MPARTRMTMRAYIQRNDGTTNTYGQKSPTDWVALNTVSCYAWVVRDVRLIRDNSSMEERRVRLIVPLGTDVTSDDRIEKITDRAGTELFGTVYVDAVSRRKDHLEVATRAHE